MGARLAGKTALISGGAGGAGAAAVRRFAAGGAAVAIVDRDATAGAALAAELSAAGHRAAFFAADVSRAADVAAAVAGAVAALGPMDILVNHAGTIVVKPLLEVTEDDWDGLFAINVKSMFLMTRAVVPHMLAKGGGSIVCTSSVSAQISTPMEALYDATKGACHAFARAVAVEYRDRNIRCNAVCPGFIDTPHGRREVTALSRLGVDASDAAISARQGRFCKPEEVAEAMLFLASDEAAFITGTHLFVDNGFTSV